MLNFTKTAWERLDKQHAATGDYGDIFLCRNKCGRYHLRFSVTDRFGAWQETIWLPTQSPSLARAVRDALVAYVRRGSLMRESQIDDLRRVAQKFIRDHQAAASRLVS